MVYSAAAPYEVLQTSHIDFESLQRLRRFARYWDLVANSGNFVETTPQLWGNESPFHEFLKFCDWLYTASGKTSGISLKRLAELVFRYLTEVRRLPVDAAAPGLWRDYQCGGKSDRPEFLRPYLDSLGDTGQADTKRGWPKRQMRHLRESSDPVSH